MLFRSVLGRRFLGCRKGGWTPVATVKWRSRFYTGSAAAAPNLAISFPGNGGRVEPPLRCTVFDENGQVMKVSYEVSRKQFVRDNKLNTRDLRHLDDLSGIVPRILVHGDLILVNMCGLRVLIKEKRVMVFESQDPKVSERLSMLMYDFQSKLAGRKRPTAQSGGHVQPYEQTALEIVLVHAIAYLELEVRRTTRAIDQYLEVLESSIDRTVLRELSGEHKILGKVYRQCLAVRNALDDALDDDEGLEDMYLSARKEADSYNDIELLLETYFKEADELVQQTGAVSREVDMTQEVINMILDSNRNRLLLFRLHISIFTVSAALAVFIADMYGMNLENFIEETNFGFPLVIAAVFGFSAIGTIYNLKHLRFVQRIATPSLPHKDKPSSIHWLGTTNQGLSNRVVHKARKYRWHR
ncbi:Mitochondrial inner membrane magnesium transporter MRS2 [Wickerhamiella sorbophila]|uniref:Magnesium transporter n=1 Tax=Wickerhamiella sorbophila TaxID=45607 RepID=A0A2T0FKY9_9ASCO|nr:Mitochondrial inner membrane magnesium transporter MRS2 [Wickerhamiella sorbophila]PRT55656.1 Mitochondrial inner membrane magnesium transporter MRS2 [Wickerhamiella sorbophila]